MSELRCEGVILSIAGPRIRNSQLQEAVLFKRNTLSIFDFFMKTFVISLLRADLRRAHISSQMKKYDLTFDWFNAIDGTKNDPNVAFPTDFSFGKKLTNSQIGCFLSHLQCMELILHRGLNWATILEDDIYLGNNANFFLSSSNWIPAGIDFIKIDTQMFPSKLDYKNRFSVNHKRHVTKMLGGDYGTAGYIISSKAALKILNHAKSNINLVPIDTFLYEDTSIIQDFAVHRMQPSLCAQEMTLYPNERKFHSFISTNNCVKPTLNRVKPTLNIVQKFKRELRKTPSSVRKKIEMLSQRCRTIRWVVVPFR